MTKTISKDSPLSEITLRRYEKPTLKDRELVRKLCLSIGLLQPGDSRDVIVDVFYVLLKEKREMDAEKIREKVIEFRKQRNLALMGIASSNIRRQIKRLRDVFLIEKVINCYRITEHMTLSEIMEEKLKRYMIPSILERVNDYFKAVDDEFLKET